MQTIRIVFACLVLTALPLAAAERYLPKDFEERQFRDWLLQDAGADAASCFSAAEGNALETRVLEKVLAELDADELRTKFAELKQKPGGDPAWKESYLRACKLRRQIRLKPVLDSCPEIVYAKHQVLGGSHYSYTEAPTDAQFPERRDIPGGKLMRLRVLPDGSVEEKQLVETAEGLLRDPDVSYDAKKVVFSMRTHLTEDDFHLYDYDLESGETRQLTFGPGFADVEPCCLPDGNILFGSTRCMQIVDCWWTDVVNQYVCDADGRFLRRVGFDQVHTNYASVLDDGRVVYTRWDYNDRGQMFPHGLFVMNFDGTGQTEFYGNNSWFPTSILHVRGIPGSNKVVAIASGHHTHQRGKLILIDRGRGTQENEGVEMLAPRREAKVVKVDRYGQDGDQFQYPLPIDEEHFIVA